jgi:lysozyme
VRKVAGIVFGLGIAFGGTFLYYWQQNQDSSLTDYIGWLESLFRGVGLKVTSAITGVTNSDDYMTQATALVAGLESFSAKVYHDSDKLAIGYGHDLVPGDGFNADSVIDEPTAFSLLESDLQKFDACIAQYVTVDLTVGQRVGLLSFIYNIGCAGFAGSTCLKKLNAGDYQGAANEMGRWIYTTVNGQKVISTTLQDTRRPAEQAAFLA